MSRVIDGRDRRPKVTGLSPKEGIPGTKIIVRGECLGESPEDLIGLTICGVDCLMFAEWKTSTKILTRSGRCDGLGDVIVTTVTGGIGTCTVQFKGLPDIISPTKDCCVWINEEEYFSIGKGGHGIGCTTPIFYSSDLLNLSSDSDSEKGKSAIAENVIREFFPEAHSQDKSERGFGNPFSRDFIPAWYLLENHSTASFSDLIKGLENLKTKINQKTSNSSLGPKALLKPNVLPIVDCLDALKFVQHNLKTQKQMHGADLTQKIEDSIKKCLSDSHDIFDSVLARKDCADSTRNALNVLQRYRFLFNLPAAIERYIENSEYDLLINDYNRAKSRFADAQVGVFRTVYSEIEQRIVKFRESLKEKLRKQCSNHESRNIDEVKKFIQYLINLEVPGNPAWENLVLIKDNLLKEMKECHDKCLELSKIPQVITKDPSSLLNEKNIDPVTQGPPIVQFIDELTTLFNHSFNDLVKLGAAYLNGDFNVKEKDLESKETIFYNEVIQRPLKFCVTLIRNALLPSSVSSVNSKLNTWPPSATSTESFVWLPRCLKICCNFYRELLKNDLPQNAMQPIQQLITDLREHSLSFLFSQAAEEVKALHARENWEIVRDDSLGTRTELPLLFENKVVEILLLVREHIIQTTCPDEVDIFSKINIQGKMKQLAQNLLLAFLIALEKVYKTLTVPTISNSSDQVCKLDEGGKILALICNCTFTSNQVLPRIHDKFEKYSYPDMSMVLKGVQNKFRELESKLFTHFVESKCDFVIDAIKPSMYTIANECYKSASRPSDVSHYVKEIITTIIEFQDKTYLIAPSLARKMVTQIIEATLEEIATLFQSVSDKLTEAGNVHASVDLSALDYAFSDSDNFESPKAEKFLSVSRSHIRPLSNPQDNKLASKILKNFKASTQLQLLCFKWASDGQTVIAI